jgi:hypothetical protein
MLACWLTAVALLAWAAMAHPQSKWELERASAIPESAGLDRGTTMAKRLELLVVNYRPSRRPAIIEEISRSA